MIITIAICLIGTLIVLANYKMLRKPKLYLLAVLVTGALAITGFLLLSGTRDGRIHLAPFFSPLTALLLFTLARVVFRKIRGMEIICYMYGIYPISYEERYVTRLEKLITFLVTALSIAIPILLMRYLP